MMLVSMALFGQINTVGIISTATPGGWDSDTSMVQRRQRPNVWTLTIKLTDGEAKFRTNDAWDINWGSSDFPSGTATQNGPNMKVWLRRLHRYLLISADLLLWCRLWYWHHWFLLRLQDGMQIPICTLTNRHQRPFYYKWSWPKEKLNSKKTTHGILTGVLPTSLRVQAWPQHSKLLQQRKYHVTFNKKHWSL